MELNQESEGALFIIRDIKTFFSLKNIKSWLIERGLEYLDRETQTPNAINRLDSAVNNN